MLCALVLMLLNLIGIFLNIGLGYDTVFGFVTYFDFNTEGNVPTLFSSLLFLIAAMLVWVVTNFLKQEGKPYRYWIGLIIILVFLSIDEIAQIHESLSHPIRTLLNTSGVLFYAWVIPYMALVILVGLIYSRFFWSLPARTKKLFMMSALLFVSGAIGLEMIGAYYDQTYGIANYTYSLLYTCEELLENIGVILFIYAVIDWLNSRYGTLTLGAK